jgi:hypothetical protein
MGTIYLFTNPAMLSLAVLGGWIAACYGGTLFGLAGKQKGR